MAEYEQFRRFLRHPPARVGDKILIKKRLKFYNKIPVSGWGKLELKGPTGYRKKTVIYWVTKLV